MDETVVIIGRQSGRSLERAKLVAEQLSMLDGIKPGEFFVLDSYTSVSWLSAYAMNGEIGIVEEEEKEYKSPAELRGEFRKGLNDMMKGRGRR